MRKGINSILAVVMVVVLMLGTVACGNNEDTTSVEEQSPIELKTDENGETVISLYKRSVSNSKNELVIENPEGKQIKGIAEGAFAGNSTVEKITLPDTIEYIDKLAFRGCSSLEKINFPSSLTVVGSASFMGTAVEEIVLPDTVVTIEPMAFANNTRLKKLSVNEGVTRLENIVEGANNLKKLYLPATITEIAQDFTLSNNNAVVYTPNNSVVITYCTAKGINYEII
ncbi:MAG: leucine-rich repeat domain-containing protein [Acutalibacteraceae bacterium]|nr:leucine-rich repeat domain-containing protein [Acutalibacteraceae bacterium]